jgi:hypothetical protein
VPGAVAAPKLVVGGITPVATPEGVQLRVKITNTGNAFAHGTGVIRVPGTNFQHDFDIDTFVPQTEIALPVNWTDDVVAGTHDVSVRLTYEDERTTSWNGTIDIVGETQARLERELRNEKSVSSGVNVLQILLVAGLVAALACAGAAIWLHRRESRSMRSTRLQTG